MTRSRLAAGAVGVAAVAASAPTAHARPAAAAPAPRTTAVELPAAISLASPAVERRVAARKRHHREVVHRLIHQARKVAHLKSMKLPADYGRTFANWSPGHVTHHAHHLRAKAHRLAAAGAGSASTAGGALRAIASCESGGNYATDTGNGFYGAYQFTQQTWAAVGGSGNPAQASPAEQDRRAAMLYSQAGAGQWPVCDR